MSLLKPEDVAKLKVAELKEELGKRGLDATGLKAVLTERLLEAVTSSASSAPKPEPAAPEATPEPPVAPLAAAPEKETEVGKKRGRDAGQEEPEPGSTVAAPTAAEPTTSAAAATVAGAKPAGGASGAGRPVAMAQWW